MQRGIGSTFKQHVQTKELNMSKTSKPKFEKMIMKMSMKEAKKLLAVLSSIVKKDTKRRTKKK